MINLVYLSKEKPSIPIDKANVHIEGPSLRSLHIDHSNRRWFDDFYPRDNDKSTSIFDSRYLYIGIIISTVVVSGLILYYN